MTKHSKSPTASSGLAGEGAATNVCMVCKKCFPSIYQMRIHQAEHTTATTKVSTKVSKSAAASTATVSALLNGTSLKKADKIKSKINPSTNQTISNSKRKVSCDLCKKQYKRVAQLQLHMNRAHAASKPFICNVCTAGFTDKAAYKLHVSTHSTDLPYKCDECGETFQYSAYLESHRVLHTGEKPFQCDFCMERFAHNSDLKFHVMFNHSGEKLYQCSTCTAKFTSDQEYQKHLQKCVTTNNVSDTDESGSNINTGKSVHYVPAKRKTLKKNPTLSPKRNKLSHKKNVAKTMTREERQLEEALRAIEKMEQRHTRKEEELKSNEAVADSFVNAALYSSPKKREKHKKVESTIKITKEVVQTPNKMEKKRNVSNKKNFKNSKKSVSHLKSTEVKTTTARPIPLTREERQMQSALRAIERMEKRQAIKSTHATKTENRGRSKYSDKVVDSGTDVDASSVDTVIPDSTIFKNRKVKKEPKIVKARGRPVKVKKSIETITVKKVDASNTGRKQPMTKEERQMAAALRAIERMEKRDARKKVELESSESAVKVRSQPVGNNEKPWLNGVFQENNDGSSTDAASEHLTVTAPRKKRFTRKKPKDMKPSINSLSVSKKSLKKRGRPKSGKSVSSMNKISTVSSSTVYQGADTSNVASIHKEEHRPIPAPGGLQDNVALSREERQMAEAMRAIERMEARKRKKITSTPNCVSDSTIMSDPESNLKATSAVSTDTHKMPECVVRLTCKNNSTTYETPPKKPNLSTNKRGRNKTRPPTDDEFSTSEEESESPPPPSKAKSSTNSLISNPSIGTKAVWSIKETAMSGKRAEPDPPKMSREERKMAAIMAQFAKMS